MRERFCRRDLLRGIGFCCGISALKAMGTKPMQENRELKEPPTFHDGMRITADPFNELSDSIRELQGEIRMLHGRA